VDAALAGLLGTAVGAVAGLGGSYLTNKMGRAADTQSWRRAKTEEAYTNCTFDLAGAAAEPPGGEQANEDGAADDAGQVGGPVGADAAGGGQFLAGGLERAGEAGPVGVGARPGLHRGHHGHAQQLVEGQQRPQFLLDAGPVA
jgi:hypothetical protein